jgi:ABC-type uncharacterized transport system permease subunit
VLVFWCLFFYFAASLLAGMRLFPSCYGRDTLAQGALRGAAVLALVLHGILLYPKILPEAGEPHLGFFTVASLVMGVSVLVYLLSSGYKPLDHLGVFVLPLAAITVLLQDLYPHRLPALNQNEMPGMGSDQRFGVEMHIVLSVLAASLLAIAAFQSLLLAYQENRLRRHRPARIMGVLPPLQTQEALLFQMIGAGFFLLSLSLVTGMMFIQDMFAQHLVHKTTLSLCAWLVFAILLWGRWRYGWRGQTAIRWSMAGFAMLTLAYFGSKLVLELILGRSWYLNPH